ncbi:hypothetical protein [Haloplanus salinus]|uniref:hypothetical protein n=1 Tax=Haloplanus salinus TaxID=1126245 RepID=UPI0015F08C63|nr:hypothetical protein [Haloplanus salinus]
MQRRKFIAGMGSLAAAGAATVGTGAFTSVQADRSLNVEVADDANAFLAIEPQSTENGDEYASVNGDGTVTLDFTGDDDTSTDIGSGLNKDADTTIRDILKVSNQGTQDVVVGVSGLPSSMSIYTDDGSVAANGSSTSLNQDNYPPNSGNLALVEVGEIMSDVGVIFRDPPNNLDFSGSLTFNAIAVDELSNFDASQYPDNL